MHLIKREKLLTDQLIRMHDSIPRSKLKIIQMCLGVSPLIIGFLLYCFVHNASIVFVTMSLLMSLLALIFAIFILI
jgi:uncharacterized membrane protein YedE/YeeE